MQRWSWVWVCLAACGGTDANPLFGGSDGSVQDTGNAMDAIAAIEGGVKDAEPVDARKDVVDPPKDSGPPTSSLACGNSSCTVPPEACCRTGVLNQYSYQCTNTPQTCTGLAIVCDKRQNCDTMGKPGSVCCGHYMFNGQSAIVNQVDCTQPANCTQQNNAIVLCDPNDSSQCLQGQTCVLSQTTIPGYYFCK